MRFAPTMAVVAGAQAQQMMNLNYMPHYGL